MVGWTPQVPGARATSSISRFARAGQSGDRTWNKDAIDSFFLFGEPLLKPAGCRRIGSWLLGILACFAPGATPSALASNAGVHWIGTWATTPQPPPPGTVQGFGNLSLRLIVHTSAGGRRVRIKISNEYGDQPLRIGSARIARRAVGANIDPTSDRALTFRGRESTTIPAGSTVVSDPAEIDVPALSDLAVSLFLPGPSAVTTTHLLALQTSYVSPETGNHTADVTFPVGRTIHTWPFLTGIDVAASPRGATIVAFGSSLTDGDGSRLDANGRYPDALAARLQRSTGRAAETGVLNEGVIGNRLLSDSPRQSNLGFGGALGEAGLERFDRDVLAQPAVRYVIVALGVNDIIFPGSFTPIAEKVGAQSLIAGYRQLIARAHRKGVRVIGTTIPPFEDAFFKSPPARFYTPENETVREAVNTWIRTGAEFDAVVDFDAAIRDPSHPTRILPDYDSGDHLHANDAGYTAQANAIPLALFED
jgi:lysophospholipase L1-like esterase